LPTQDLESSGFPEGEKRWHPIDPILQKILEHLGLWGTHNHDPPQPDDTHTPTIEIELTYDYTYSQLPPIDYWTQ